MSDKLTFKKNRFENVIFHRFFRTIQLTPHAFVSILPVSAETIALGSVNLEAELPRIFAEAFAEGFASQVLTGSGASLNFQSIFTGNTNTVNCAMAGVPRVMDLVDLALTVKDHTDDTIIVMHPSVIVV